MNYPFATTFLAWIIATLAAGQQFLPDENAKKHVYEQRTVPGDTLEWPPPRLNERQNERNKMVTQTIEGRGLTDPDVLMAMRKVPRHRFVPESQRPYAYNDNALPIGHRQTISQPYIVAYMTKLLDLEPGDKVLEIGTGSGYQAAVLAELTPHVYTIEIIEELGKEARKRFRELGYATITTKIGDGYKGWPEFAPFDAIILTAAAAQIPKPLLQQLAADGVLVMPEGEPHGLQTLIRVTKDENGDLSRKHLLPVRFVPMTGEVREQQ